MQSLNGKVNTEFAMFLHATTHSAWTQ